MMGAISEFLVKLNADSSGLETGVNKASGALDGLSGRIGGMVGAIGGLAAAAGVTFFAGLVGKSIEAAGHLADLSQETGVAASTLSSLQLAAATTGLSIDDVAKYVGKLNKSMFDAANGNNELKAAFGSLGVSVTNADGSLRKAEDVLLDVADGFSQLPEGASKSALAMELFGKSGQAMLPFLNQGRDGIAEMQAVSQAFGLTLTDDVISAADRTGDMFDVLGKLGEGFGNKLMTAVLPTLEGVTQKLFESAKASGAMDMAVAALAFTFKGLVSAGLLVSAAFKAIGTIMGAVAAAISQAVDGNFTQAGETLKAGFIDAHASGLEAGQGIKEVWTDAMPKVSDTTVKAAKSIDDFSKRQKDAEERAKAAAAEAKKHAEELEKLRLKYTALDDGLTEDYFPTLVKLAELRKKNALTEAQYLGALDDLVRKQPAVIANMKAMGAEDEEAIKRLKALAEAHREELDNADKRIGSISEETQRLQDQVRQMLQSEEGVRALEDARIADALALAEQTLQMRLQKGEQQDLIDLAAIEVEELRALQNARKGLYDATEVKKYRDASVSMWQSIDQTAHDTWVNVFEGGDNVFKKLGDTIKASILDLLYQISIRPVLMRIVASITGTSLSGAQASLSGGGLFGGGNFLGDFGGSVQSSLFDVSGWLANNGYTDTANWLGANAQGIGQYSQMFGNGLSYGNAIMSALDGRWGAAAGQAIGTYFGGPIGGWIGSTLGGLVDNAFGGETRGGGQYGYNFGDGVYNARRGTWLNSPSEGVNLLEGPSGGEIAGAQVRGAIGATVGTINGLLSSLGSSAQLTDFHAGLETSDNGRGGVFAGGRLSNGSTFGESGQGDNYAGTLYESGGGNYTADEAMQAFGLDLQQATIQALQAAGDLPQIIADQIADVDAESLSSDAATAILQSIVTQVSNANALQAAFAPLGGALSAIADSSLQARLNIIQLSGGIDALSANAQGYISNYYSADEQNAITANAVAQRLIDAGVDISGLDTREEFRALVDSLQANIEDPVAQEQLAALLSVQGGFAQLTDYMQAQGLDLEHLANLSPGGPLAEAMTAQADTSAETADNTSQIADTQAQMLTAQREQTGEIKVGLQAVTDAVAAMAARIEAMGDKILARPIEINLPASNDLNWGQS